MNRELRIFLCAIFLPILLIAWGGFRLIYSEAERLDDTDLTILESVADRAALGLREACHAELDPLLDELAAIPTTNELAAAVRRVEATCPWVRRISRGGVRSRGYQRGWRSNVNGNVPTLRVMTAAETRPLIVELESLYVLSRLPGILKKLGVDDPDDPSRQATVAEIRQIDDALLCPASSVPPRDSVFAEAPLGMVFENWKILVYRRLGPAAFDVERRRLVCLGVVVLVLLIASLCIGGAMLLSRAWGARQEARLKTNFISMMSHEFKTPLTTIGLCMELALEGELDVEERRRAALTVQREASRLQHFLEDVLSFSRLEAGRYAYHPQAFDLAALVRDAVDLRADRVEQPTFVAAGDCPVFADRAACEMIVGNLLENAAKYAGKGPLDISFGPADRLGFQLVTFADRGPGLTKDQRKHVFDRFWRADDATTRETSGSGLGLCIARGLARGMGGELSVRAREGGGCVFTFQVPAVPPGKVRHG